MYAWLTRWLLGDENAPDTEPDPPGVSDDMEVLSYEELTAGLPPDNLFFLEISGQMREGLPELAVPGTLPEWSAQFQDIRDALEDLMQWPASSYPVEVTPGDPEDNPEEISILPEDLVFEVTVGGTPYSFDSMLEAELYKPDRPPPWACVILLNPLEHPGGDFDDHYGNLYVPLDDAAVIDALTEEGYAVLKVTLRFNDVPTHPGRPENFFETAAAIQMNHAGHPLFGRHVYDVLMTLAYLQTRDDIRDDHVSVWGMGPGGPVAVTAGAVEEELCQVVADRALISFGVEGTDRHPVWFYCPKIMLGADLPQLGAMVVPRRLVVAGSRNALRQPYDAGETAIIMDWVVQSYDDHGAPGQLRLQTEAAPEGILSALDPVCAPLEYTAIELVSFAAEEDSGAVRLSWETATEPDNAGFHLLRARAAGGEYQRITSSLLPAEGDETGGAQYEWIDEDVEAGGAYWYKLEDIDLHGASAFYGPVEVTVEAEPFFGCGGISY